MEYSSDFGINPRNPHIKPMNSYSMSDKIMVKGISIQ